MQEKLKEAMISHMREEFSSYWLYLSMAGHFETQSWEGFAHWMHMQAEEEREHGMKFYQFLLDVGVKPKLLDLPEPKDNWENVLQVFEESLEHEEFISGGIHKLMDIAVEVKDYPAQSFLKWFVDEQVEEEATVGAIVDQLKRIDNDNKGLMMMDRELGSRQPEEDE